MIENVKNFVEQFFQLELDAKTASMKKDLELAEKKIKSLYAVCSNDCFNKLGVVLPVSKEDDEYYNSRIDAKFETPRHLYKVSHYKNSKMEDVWICYVSVFLSSPRMSRFFRMEQFLIIKKNGNDFLIVGFGSRNPDDPAKWVYDFGDPDFDIQNPGEFISTTRYLEPTSDEISMEKWRREE